MLVFIILFLVLITLYFSTKEGLDEITDTIPIPSNAAVYKTPIEMMDKINYILDGNTTPEEALQVKIKQQNDKISDYSNTVSSNSEVIKNQYDTLTNTTIPRQTTLTAEKQGTINNYTQYIANATDLNKLCNQNGPTNKLSINQPNLKNVTDYITMLDNVYFNLKTVNTELIDKYNKYNAATPTNYTKVTANFMTISSESLQPEIYVATP